MKKFLGIFLVLVVLAGGGYGYYAFKVLPAQAAPTPALQTATARRGDILITASGTGTVLPAAQVDLAFRSAGLLAELDAAVGDSVKQGQVLARLEDSAVRLQLAQAELNYRQLFSATAIREAETAVTAAEDALAVATDKLSYLVGATVLTWEVKLAGAQVDLEAAQAALKAGTGSQGAVEAAEKSLRWAEINLEQAQIDYAADNLYPPTDETVALARANLETAEQKLKEAQVYLAILQGETVSDPDLALVGSGYFQLEQARLNLESVKLAVDNMQLTSPLDGTVTKVSATAGQTVGTGPIVSLATLDQLLVRFYIEEADLGKLHPGSRVNYTFDAYPDLTVGGEVLRLEPVLATVDGAPAVVAWASVEPLDEVVLISGMAIEVEVIAGEAKGTLLVPAQALRELAPGSYAVFVVQPDGQLKLTSVTIGLRDFANVEILSGLKAGDVVSTGNVETK